MAASLRDVPNRPETVTPVKRERATFAIGTEPKKDDGLRQVPPDAALLAWAARMEQRR